MALRIATRGSALALTQSGMVAEMLGGAELVEVSSDGEPGDKSRFVRAVEQAVLDGRAEIGVHSAKDLPGEKVEGLEIAAVPPREDPADAWIGAGTSLEDAPEGARVGTVSLRRRAQLLAARPDLRVLDLNGNVDTRLRRLAEGDYDAIILAAAGLRRLGRDGEIGFRVPEDRMVPAAGQGALAIQVRSGDEETAAAVAAISDAASFAALLAERVCFTRLEADCSTPIGVHAKLTGDVLRIGAFVGLPDGGEWIRDELEADANDPQAAGTELAKRLLGAGAAELLARATKMVDSDD
ncbi:MAG TPA: hydroxymethylbilane synthase [Solirubrobacterales bacterium]|nr:hydroxymethylbilane synthase [Solirubrobacterales bacterium]